MTPADELVREALQWGLVLGFGLGLGVSGAVRAAIAETRRQFNVWRHGRIRALRCDRSLECVLTRGHGGDCDEIEYE